MCWDSRNNSIFFTKRTESCGIPLAKVSRSKRFLPWLVIAIVFVLTACAGQSGTRFAHREGRSAARQASFDRQAFLKGQNSYYYYIIAELKTLKEKEDEAFIFLKQALKKGGESAYLTTQKAYFEARFNNLDQARQDATKALGKDPKNVEALLLLGKIHSGQRDFDQAISFYRQALKADPKNEEAYNLLARDYLVTENLNLAIASLKHCQGQLPESIPCLYYLGTIYLEKKNYDQALDYFTLITDFNPEQTKTLETIGEIYIKKNDFKRALEVFKQLSQQNPDSLTSQMRVGLLYYQINETDHAISEFLQISERFPSSDRVNYFLGLLFLEKKQFDQAYPFFDRVLPGSVLFRESLNRQFLILKETGQFAKAAELLDRRFPSRSLIEYYNLKSTLMLLQLDYKGAVAVLNQGLSRFKNDEQLLFQRALAHEKLNQWDKAKKDLMMLITLYPTSAEPYNFLGYTMAERDEDLEIALSYVKKAHEIKPNEGHILDSLAWVYFKLNKIDRAVPLLTRAVNLEPKEPTILEHMGHVLFAIKNKRRAREYFNKSLEILRDIERKRPEDLEQIKNIEKKLAEF